VDCFRLNIQRIVFNLKNIIKRHLSTMRCSASELNDLSFLQNESPIEFKIPVNPTDLLPSTLNNHRSVYYYFCILNYLMQLFEQPQQIYKNLISKKFEFLIIFQRQTAAPQALSSAA